VNNSDVTWNAAIEAAAKKAELYGNEAAFEIRKLKIEVKSVNAKFDIELDKFVAAKPKDIMK
jgi:hypothetical protein